MIRITSGNKPKNCRGLVFARTSIRNSEGKFYDTWVMGICSLFQDKEPVKAWVKERGGTWHPIKQFWYAPVSGVKIGEVLENFWELAMAAIADLENAGVELRIGSAVEINLDAPLNQETETRVLGWLEKKARIQTSNFSVVSGGAQIRELPCVSQIEKQEETDDNGVTRAVRYIALCLGNPEYVYPQEPTNSLSLYELKSGLDADGNRWYWLAGERDAGVSFGLSDCGGWVLV